MVSEWVDETNNQLGLEAAKAKEPQAKKKSSAGDLGFDLDIHAPVDPVPDQDWVGETWGLFWPDTELEDKSEDPNKYIKKHYEDKSKKKDYPPANDSATTHSVDVLTCPRPATPPPPPKPAPPPPVVMRKKKTPPPAPVEEFEGPRDVEGDNSKWSWMRSSDRSAGKARFSLSIYW